MYVFLITIWMAQTMAHFLSIFVFLTFSNHLLETSTVWWVPGSVHALEIIGNVIPYIKDFQTKWILKISKADI